MIKFSFYLLTVLFLLSCIAEKGDISINIKRKNLTSSNSSTISNASISSVQIISNQLVITGTGLGDVEVVKVNGNSLNENFSIETKTATKIIANSIRAFSLDVSKVFNLILSDASASATFPIDFSLCNSSLNGKGFDCAVTALDKDVLSFDQATNKWKPRSINGLSYQGAWDATDPLPATTTPGDYFIVSVASTPYGVGDWIVWNGGSYDQISNSTTITSVFGRTGAIVATEGDYNLNKLLDVDLTVAPTAGKILKYDGVKWIAGDDLSGGGAGSITSTELAANSVTDVKIDSVSANKITGTLTSAQIADGAIVNADINAAAAIDYSKLNIPAESIPYAKLNIANGDIPAAKISGLPAATSVLATTIVDADTTHAPDGNAVFDALGLKLNLTGGILSIGTISGVPTPTNSDDVANKSYTDTRDALKLAKAGDIMTGVLTLDSDLKIKGGSNYVTVKGHATSTAYNLFLPIDKGINGYVLSTDGNGNTSWVDVTSAVTNIDTDDVDEATNLYFTETRVLGTDLAGLNTGVAGPIVAADTILGAAGKLQYQVTDLKSKGQWDKNVNDISYGAGNVEINTKLRLKDTGTNFVELKAPATVTTTYTLTFPANDGNVNQVLRTDGAGVLTWVDVTDASIQAFAKAALPTCVAGEVLKSNGTSFSCIADNAGAGAFSGTASKAVITSAGGVLDVSATSATELGYVAGVTSAIQTQLNSKETAITAGTTAQYLNGAKNFVTLDTLAVPENTNLYFTGPRVLATNLTGFVTSNTAITAADSILTGLEKSQGQITNLGTIKANVAGDTFTGDVTLNTQLRLKDGSAGTYVILKAPASGTTTHTLTLPGTVGTSGQVLSMTGTAGVLAWTTPSTSAIPSGTAGGDLSGSFPNPTIAALDATKIATGVVDNTEFNYLNGVTSSIQTQLTGKQATDATLTALAGYNTNGILVQTAADTFIGRSVAGTANRVAVTNGDGVSGNPTINVSTTLLPSPVVGDVGKYLKATAADTSVWTALSTSDITTALGYTPVNKAGDSLTTGVITLSGAAVLRTPNPIGLTDVANKQYVDSYGQWIISGSDIYRSSGNVGLGTSAPDRRFTIIGDGTTYGDDMWMEGANSATATPQINLVRSRGTSAARTPVLANDVLGTVAFRGEDSNGGTTFPYAGRIDGVAETDFATQVNGALSFLTTSAGTINERVRITSGGLVGIGTTAPTSNLQVSRTIASTPLASFADNAAANNFSDIEVDAFRPGIVLRDKSTSADDFRIGAEEGKLYFSADLNDDASKSTDSNYNDSVMMTVTSAGNVGIGTTAPMARLDVRNGAINRSIQLVPSIDNTAANGSKIEFRQNDNGNVNALYASIQGHLQSGATGYNAGELIFNTAPMGAGNPAAVERFRINAAGDVGLGTSVPNIAADTTGRRYLTIKGTGTAAATGSGVIQLTSNAVEGLNTNLGNIEWHDSTNTSGNTRSGYISMFTAGATANNRGADMTLATRPDNGSAAIDRVRITAAGLVGINTTNPGSMLEVYAGDVTLKAGTTNVNDPGDLVFRDNAGVEKARVYANGAAGGGLALSGRAATPVTDIFISSTGAVGIGTAAPSYTLHVNGSVAGTGAYNALSDMRLKKDITVIPNSLEKIEALRGVSFNWRKDVHPELKLGDKGEIGVIAQEVKKVFPEAITVDKKTGIMSVAYSMLIAPLIEAVKELFHDSKVVKREIASLKNENQELKAKNEQLTNYLCHKDPKAPFCKHK